MPDLPTEAVMPRVPKLVGVRQNTKDGLWKDFGERLVRKEPAPQRRGRAGRRGNRSYSSKARLEQAFRDEDERT